MELSNRSCRSCRYHLSLLSFIICHFSLLLLSVGRDDSDSQMLCPLYLLQISVYRRSLCQTFPIRLIFHILSFDTDGSDVPLQPQPMSVRRLTFPSFSLRYQPAIDEQQDDNRLSRVRRYPEDGWSVRWRLRSSEVRGIALKVRGQYLAPYNWCTADSYPSSLFRPIPSL